MKLRYVTLLVLFVLVGTAWAQDATPETITLVPYTDDAYGIQSVVPEGWTNMGNGIIQSPEKDNILIAQQAAPLAPDALLNAILPQLGLSEAPESVGTQQGATLEWTLYQVDVETVNLRVDVGLAESEGTTYIVLLQAPPDAYDMLHTAVFLPTLDTFAPLAPEVEDVPYTVADVTFDNGDITLAGTLTLPVGEGPYPVLVLVTGSGPQDRNESLGAGIAIKPFKLLADGLTRAGMAVLRYDDRGVAQSTGDFASATTADFATDATAAINYLLSREDINPNQIGLLGHSEGGLVAAILGASNPVLDFIISLAGPGVNGAEVLRLQNERIMEAGGATEEQIADQLDFLDQLMTLTDDPQAIEDLAYEQALAQLNALPEDQRAQVTDPERRAHELAAQAGQQYATPWFKSFLTYDPAPDWGQTSIPVLALFGGHDKQVDAVQNAPAVDAALAAGGNHDYAIVVLPQANHLFQVAETGSPDEYATLPAEFTPDLLPTIISWLQVRGIIAG